MKGVDFGKTAGDYGRFRQGFPPALFERLAARGIGLTGQRLLDLGTGTGLFARGFALRGCTVTGLDPSAALLEEAVRMDRAASLSVEHVEARAEQTGLATRSFDVVTAGSCWHWFDSSRAAAEAHRLLEPGGAIVIASLDWVATPGNIIDDTEALIEHHNPAWTLRASEGLRFAADWLRDLAGAGFDDLETFTFDFAASYSHEAWRGRIRASAGVGATLEPAAVARFDDQLGALLARNHPTDPLAVPHRVFALVGHR